MVQFIHYCNTYSKSLELTGAVSLLLPPAWSVTLRGLSGPVLGTGGGDLDCLTADDGGITKFPLLLNSRDLDEIEVRNVFVHHHLVKFQNLTKDLQFRTMKILSAKSILRNFTYYKQNAKEEEILTCNYHAIHIH